MEANPTEGSLRDEIRAMLRGNDPAALPALLAAADPVDVAGVFYSFSLAEQISMLGLLPSHKAAEVLCALDHPTQQALLGGAELELLARLIPAMEPDDAADLVGMMEQGRAAELLRSLPPLTLDRIAFLLKYAKDTAGGLMDPDVVRVRADHAVHDAVAEVRGYVARVELDDFFSVFVVDDDGALRGTVPTWKMLLARPEQSIGEIMDPMVFSVPADMDQEEVSRLVRDHDLVSVPVVDERNHLIGRITHDDIVDVIDEEHEEDMGRLTGTMGEEVREISLLHTVRLRIPWLFIALAGEFLLALFMKKNESFLVSLPQLAFFFPLIMAMGGTSGIQSASLVIRGLATGEVEVGHWRRRLAREFVVALAMGVPIAGVLLVGGTVMLGDAALAGTVSLATLLGIVLAATGGTAIPLALEVMGVDPALATGPFITTLNDILGILVYLGIAWLMLG